MNPRKEIRARAAARLFDPAQTRAAAGEAFRMLAPRRMARNPVMFVTELGAFVSTVALFDRSADLGNRFAYTLAVVVVLWLTVLFANFAEALAEARGRAQAEGLRKTRQSTRARRRTGAGEETVLSESLRPGDLVIVRAGEIIPGDGEVVEGIATVDESAITGESAPVVREAGTDRSGVTGGTRVLSDGIVVRITAGAGESFLDRMIALVEGASRQKTPNELALTVTLAGLTLAFLLVTGALGPIGRAFGVRIPVPTLVALLVCLIPTTIGALLAAIGLAGMDRALAANVVAKSGKAVELAGDIDTLLLDKTGTITIGDRQAVEFVPLAGVTKAELAEAAVIASFGDPTPEGRSIVRLGELTLGAAMPRPPADAVLIPFSAETRLSGLDAKDGRSFRKGAADAIEADIRRRGGSYSRRPAGSRGRRGPRRPDADRRFGRPAGSRRRLAVGRPQARHPRPLRPPAGHGSAGRHGHRRQSPDGRRHRRRSRGRRLPGRGQARGQAGLHPARAEEPGAWSR